MDDRLWDYFFTEIKKEYTLYLIICSKDKENYIDKLYFTKNHIKYGIDDVYEYMDKNFCLSVKEVDILIVRWVNELTPKINFNLEKFKPITMV